METFGSVASGFTIASIVSTAGITLNMTENFGDLVNSGALEVGRTLHGHYGDSLLGMGSVEIAMTSVYVFLFLYGLLKYRKHARKTVQKIYWTLFLLTVVIGFINGVMVVYLVQNFENMLQNDQLEFSPKVVPENQNYQLRGIYGTATMAVSSVAVAFSSISIMQMTVAWANSWKMEMQYDTYYHD